jgi:hypothetical protein
MYANIKDGLRVLQEKYQSVKNAKAVTSGGITYSAEDMKNISATFRYNQGSPYKVQAVYLVFEGRLSMQEIQDELISHGASASWVRGTFTGEWKSGVEGRCSGASNFTNCLSQTNQAGITTSAFYLRDVANKLDTSQFVLADKLSEANRSSVLLWLRSPGELQVTDSQGNNTGIINGVMHEDIPNSMYDPETGYTTLLFPDPETTYTVKGTATGTYGLVVTNLTSSSTVVATDIPTTAGAVHEYSVDWQAVAASGPGVTIKIDQNGDGAFEKEVHASTTFSDTVSPEAILSFDPAARDLMVKGIDDLSPNVTVATTSNGYLLKDVSGNTIIISFDKFKDKKKKLLASIGTLKYQGVPTGQLSENALQYDWEEDKAGTFKSLTQKIIIKKEERMRAEYNPKKNETKIFVRDLNASMKVKETLPGLVLLKLTTNQGKLDVSY